MCSKIGDNESENNKNIFKKKYFTEKKENKKD